MLIGIESLAAAETNEAASKKQFDYAQKRLDVGLAPITDVHEAKHWHSFCIFLHDFHFTRLWLAGEIMPGAESHRQC